MLLLALTSSYASCPGRVRTLYQIRWIFKVLRITLEWLETVGIPWLFQDPLWPQPFGTRIEKWSSCSLGESLVFSLPTMGCMLISSYFPPGQPTPFFLSPQLQLPWLRLAVAFQALDGFCSWNVTFLACIVINWSDTQNSIARFWCGIVVCFLQKLCIF